MAAKKTKRRAKKTAKRRKKITKAQRQAWGRILSNS